MKFKVDWFLAGMGIAVLLAWLFPDPGAHGGALHPEVLNKAGVALIFYLHGVGISFAALRAGTLQWPVHLLVQTTTFLIFPLIYSGRSKQMLLLQPVAPSIRLATTAEVWEIAVE